MAVHATEPSTTPTARFGNLDLDRDEDRAEWQRRLNGGTDNGPRGLRPHYHPDYYGAFVLDPDGHNIEAVCHRGG